MIVYTIIQILLTLAGAGVIGYSILNLNPVLQAADASTMRC